MPKEYTLIGGNGTRVSPLEVNESGTYEAGDSRAFNPVKVNVPSGSSTLSGLTDVDISNPSDGQTLVYNATSGKWENGAGGGGLVVPFDFVDEKPTLMTKAGDIYDAMARGKHVVVVSSVPNVGVVQAQPLYCVSIDPQSSDKLFVLSEPGATILMTADIPIGVYTAETDDDYPTLNGGS